MKKGIFLILILAPFSVLFAQTEETNTVPPLTVPWEVVEVNDFPALVPYPAVKQIDVIYSITIWREIDLREKRNQSLYFPTEPQGCYRSLGQLILDAIDMDNPENENALPVYTNEDCNIKVERKDLKNVLSNTRKIAQYDSETGDAIGEKDFQETFTASQIMLYRLKEVWFFNKNRGELSVRILEIEPFFEYEKDAGGTVDDEDNNVTSLKTKRRLGNIKYDELRPYLAKQLYYTPKNTALQITFDDVLTWKRYFSSYIIAESTQQNSRQINEYIKNPRDQRIESERIMNMIRNYESDLWEY